MGQYRPNGERQSKDSWNPFQYPSASSSKLLHLFLHWLMWIFFISEQHSSIKYYLWILVKLWKFVQCCYHMIPSCPFAPAITVLQRCLYRYIKFASVFKDHKVSNNKLVVLLKFERILQLNSIATELGFGLSCWSFSLPWSISVFVLPFCTMCLTFFGGGRTDKTQECHKVTEVIEGIIILGCQQINIM